MQLEFHFYTIFAGLEMYSEKQTTLSMSAVTEYDESKKSVYSLFKINKKVRAFYLDLHVVEMCPQGRPNLSQHPQSSLSQQKEDFKSGHLFYGLLHQDPDWWKKAQLLLAEEVESKPGPMWYCAVCTHKITPYQTSIRCNHLIPHWIHLKCSHTKLKTYSLSFECHSRQIPTPKTFFHTHNQTQKNPKHINKLNQSPKTNQLLPKQPR